MVPVPFLTSTASYKRRVAHLSKSSEHTICSQVRCICHKPFVHVVKPSVHMCGFLIYAIPCMVICKFVDSSFVYLSFPSLRGRVIAVSCFPCLDKICALHVHEKRV